MNQTFKNILKHKYFSNSFCMLPKLSHVNKKQTVSPSQEFYSAPTVETSIKIALYTHKNFMQ
jgi:hypothetical protein